MAGRASLRSAVHGDFVIPRTNTAMQHLVHRVFVSPVQLFGTNYPLIWLARRAEDREVPGSSPTQD